MLPKNPLEQKTDKHYVTSIKIRLAPPPAQADSWAHAAAQLGMEPVCIQYKPRAEELLAVAGEFAAQPVEQEFVASTAAGVVVVVVVAVLVAAAAAEEPELAELGAEAEIAKVGGQLELAEHGFVSVLLGWEQQLRQVAGSARTAGG